MEKEISLYDKKISTLQSKTDEESLNFYAILCAKNSRPAEAEKIWINLITKYENEVYLLNYMRLLYIMESYNEIKILLKHHLTSKYRDRILIILENLKKAERNTEKSLYLEVIAEMPEYSKIASGELADFYLNNGDYDSAKSYYEKILSTFAYDTSALEALFMIYVEEENWRNALTYGKLLRNEKYKKLEFIQNLMRTYYQIGDYRDLVEYFEEVSEIVKENESILKLYINSKIILNPIWSPAEFKKSGPSKKSPDKSLEYYFSDERRKMIRDIFKGQ